MRLWRMTAVRTFVSMVRTVRWKYVHSLDDDFGQLFALLEDPYEDNNLWKDPEKAQIYREMFERLTNWRTSSASTDALSVGLPGREKPGATPSAE